MGGRLGRDRVSTVLVVLTVIATAASTVAVWARTTLLDTDRFMTVVEGALSDPSFFPALSEVVTEQVLAALAPGIAAALELRVAEVVEISITSEVVTAWLPELVWQAHAGGVASVRGELTQRPNIDIRDGEVRIDLVPVIAQALQETQADRRHVTPRSHRGGMTDERA